MSQVLGSGTVPDPNDTVTVSPELKVWPSQFTWSTPPTIDTRTDWPPDAITLEIAPNGSPESTEKVGPLNDEEAYLTRPSAVSTN